MASFDEETNGTYSQTWYSHEGDPEDFVYFPSSTYGIDANRTFEYDIFHYRYFNIFVIFKIFTE